VSRRVEKPGPKPRILAATVVAVTAMGLTACAAGTSAAAPTTTVTQTLQASPALPVSSVAAIPSAQASGSADSSSAGRLLDYRPSTVVSKSEYSTVLTSPDSVSKVGEFYRTALAAGSDEPVADGRGEVEAAELGPIACLRRTAAIADLRFRWRLGCS
jgi:hypothetical protein